MDKQKIIIIGGGLLLVLSVVVVLNFFLPNVFLRTPPSPQSSTGGESFTSQKGNNKQYSLQRILNQGSSKTSEKIEIFTPEYARDVAKKTLNWLNKTRIYKARLDNPSTTGEFICDGGYAAAESCTDKGMCATRMIANNVGLIATWAHYKYYEQVERDPAIMQIIGSDLGTYANTKKISAIQPATWNLKLMYEMWSGSELTVEQKKLVKDIAYRMQHDPSVIDPIDAQVHNLVELPLVTTLETTIPESEKPLVEKDNLYSIFASEYTYSYLFIRDLRVEDEQPYLNIAVGLYNEAIRKYMTSGKDERIFNPYLFGVAALDLYKVTKNETFLDTASQIADRHLESNCEDNMNLCSTRVYFYHELLKVNTKQEYLRARNMLLQRILSDSYDSNKVGGFRIGKQAFYSEDMTREESLSYELTPNALLVHVLIEL